MAQPKKKKKKKGLSQQDILKLQRQKRNGIIRLIAAVAAFIIVVAIKQYLTACGIEWANSMAANGAIFLLAVVLAGVTGYATKDITRAGNELKRNGR